jgi:hypothetical protein
LEPGTHRIDVSHPWCNFFPVVLKLKSDGSFEAESNSSSTREFPIAIKHMANTDSDIFANLLGSKWVLAVILVPIGVQFLKKYLASPELLEKMKQKQAQLRAEVEQERRQRK